MRAVARLVAALCCLVGALASAWAEKRVALIVGNSSYAHIAGLPNVPNDTKAMGALFKAANFDAIDVLIDLDGGQLRRALKAFAGRAADADVAVLYYAGHGIEVGQANYLIPVDARLATDFDIEDETVPLDRVLQAMEPARRLRLVLLDACRENPFLTSMRRTVANRSISRGLGRVEPSAANTLIAFATKPNAVAADGQGPNSPFTAALVKHLLTPGLDLRLALGKVRDEVMASTGGRQEPYVTSSLGGEVVSITPGMPSAESTPAPRPTPPFAPSAPKEVDDWFIPVLTAADERALKPKDRFKDCFKDSDHCPMMVVVPAGSFVMGSPEGEDGRDIDEGPQRTVTVASFAIGMFEVTFAEWDACVAAGGCLQRPDDRGWGRDRRPVINVSWDDITKEYLPWLSRTTGKIYRLPTEAEWEYSARAGTTTPYSTGESISTSQANFKNSKGTVAVGSFPPNRFGLHDMHGNVWEWVQDCSTVSYAPQHRPAAVQMGDWCSRTVRGGSWAVGLEWALRSANRDRGSSTSRGFTTGFRVARNLGR